MLQQYSSSAVAFFLSAGTASSWIGLVKTHALAMHCLAVSINVMSMEMLTHAIVSLPRASRACCTPSMDSVSGPDAEECEDFH